MPDAFDPETSGTAFDVETSGTPFDIETAGSPASPQDRLQALAPLVAQADSKPEDEAAYVTAYKDFYAQNPRASALGSALSSAAQSVGSTAADALAHPIDTGHHLWNTVKSAWDNNTPLGGPGASNEEKAQNLSKAFARTIVGDPRALIGAAKGAGSAIYQAANVGGAGIEQWANLAADLKNPALTGVSAQDADNARQYAAQQSIQRLKMGARAAQMLAPSTSGSGSDAATELGGNIIGQAAAGSALPGASLAPEASTAAGDFVTNALTNTAGATLKAIKPLGNTAIAAGSAYGAVKGLTQAPLETVVSALAGGAGHKFISKLNGFKQGLFERTSVLGDRLMATPMGQSAVDTIVANGPEEVQSANQILNGRRAEMENLLAKKANAVANGETTIPFKKQITKAQAAIDGAELKAHVTQQGLNTAQMIQRIMPSGLPQKLSDSLGSAIVGGLTGAAVGAANSQPGQRAQAAKGAYVGGVLGMLGAASLGAHDTVAQGEVGDLAPTPLRVGDDYTPAVTKPPMAPSGLSPEAIGAASDLRKAADRLATNTFVLDGVPHDTGALADSLDKVSKSFSNAARQDGPGETFKYNTQPAFGAEHYQTKLSDQQLDHLVSLHQPPPKASTLIKKIGYDPEIKAWSGEFYNPGHQGVTHYVGPDVLPEEYQAWMQADSPGKHFNAVIKKQMPVLRVHEQLIPDQVSQASASPQ